MPPEDDHLALAAYGPGRASAPRTAVAHATMEAEGAFTVEELACAVRQADAAISTATTYRSVAAMLANGFIERVGERGGSALYARCCATGHHHHVVCTECGAVAQAPCPVDSASLAQAADGFVVTGHEVTLYGLCPACAAREPSSGRE